jgi:glycosyltransferase involved in cell wall biosynthesis
MNETDLPYVSIIIPVFNEAESVENTILELKSELQNTNFTYEIIAVNDGSNDETLKVLSRVKDIQVINRLENRGYGYSIKEGIENSRANKIMIVDADGSYPVNMTGELLSYSDKYSMVIGERKVNRFSMAFLNRAAKIIIRTIIFILSRYWIKDFNSGMRIFNKSLARRYWNLFPDGFSFTTTITVATLIENKKIKFVPIIYNKRVGKSKLPRVSSFFGFILLVSRITIYFRPLRFYFLFSSVFFLLFILRAARDVYVTNSFGNASLILFLISMQALFFGLLADLIVRHSNKR